MAAKWLGLLAGVLIAAAAPAPTSPSPDWEALARAIVLEHNLLRRDPPAYARHLEAMLGRFDGALLERPDRTLLQTIEGAAPVREAVEALRRTAPMDEMRWSPGMAAAAADHVRDQGPGGGLEHDGTDGSSPADRVGRYGRWHRGIAENMAFGQNPAREVVLQLLIDDGVPGRGHRATMLDPRYRVAGAGCGPHAGYRQMCVVGYAVDYTEAR